MFWLLPILNSFVKQYLTEAVRTKITSNIEKCIPPTVKKIIIMWIYGCIKGLLKIRDLVCLSVSNVFLTISKHKSLILNLFALLKITWQLDLNISILPLFWWFIHIEFVSNFDFFFLTELIFTHNWGNNSDFYNILSNYTPKLFSCVFEFKNNFNTEPPTHWATFLL